MRLFGSGQDPQEARAAEARRQRQQESVRRLQAGGLPLDAVDRLGAQAARQGTPGHLFTGDLSAAEVTLVAQIGYQPLGQVMGSSVYHVGWQWIPWSSWLSGELEVLTEAYFRARHLALGRLQQEAALLHATGVVGVRLEQKAYEWGAGMLEFIAIGTAIREQDIPPPGAGTARAARSAAGSAPAGGAPFVSDLSGQDFWKLRQGGYRPVGIAAGNCTYYQVPTWGTRWATTGGLFNTGAWLNLELPDYTRALYNARSLAMQRMEREARQTGASGVVGVSVDVEATPREVEVNHQRRIDMLFHFTAIGTAVAPYPAPSSPLSIELNVPLRQ